MCWLEKFIHWDVYLGVVFRALRCIDCKVWAWPLFLLRCIISMEIHYLLAWYVYYEQLKHSLFYMLGFSLFHFATVIIVFVFGMFAIWNPGEINDTRKFFIVYKILNVVMDILLLVGMIHGVFKWRWILPPLNIRQLIILIVVAVDMALDIAEIMMVGIHCCCHD